MPGIILAFGGICAVILGVSVLSIPGSSTDFMKSMAARAHAPRRLYTSNVVKFTAWVFILAGVLFVIVGIVMATTGF